MPRRRASEDDPNLQPLIDSSVNAFRQLDPRAQAIVVVLLIVVGIVAAVIYFRGQHSSPGVQASADMLLGNPSHATPDGSNRDDYLMVKPYYALSYNDEKGIPNWVSWETTAADLGDAPRKPVFDPDDTLPPGFNVVRQSDYSHSGFDRGHMCPHSDRAANEQMSYATFVMTNIIPQAPNVNRKAWAQLESYCRELVREHQHLYTIAGPLGQGGRVSEGPRQTIGGGKVVVPAECWKVVVVVREDGGDNDLAKISMGTRVIAVDMPNDNTQVGEEWDKFRTSPSSIERKTGFKFFTNVRPDIARALEQEIDQVPIPAPRPVEHSNSTR